MLSWQPRGPDNQHHLCWYWTLHVSRSPPRHLILLWYTSQGHQIIYIRRTAEKCIIISAWNLSRSIDNKGQPSSLPPKRNELYFSSWTEERAITDCELFSNLKIQHTSLWVWKSFISRLKVWIFNQYSVVSYTPIKPSTIGALAVKEFYTSIKENVFIASRVFIYFFYPRDT